MLPYKLHRDGGVVLVEFVALSLPEGPDLDAMAARLQEELMRSQTKRMILDCGRLQFMASRGLSIILTLSRLAEQHKGGLAVCGLRPQVAQVFRFCGLDRLIKITGGRDEAIAALGSP